MLSTYNTWVNADPKRVGVFRCDVAPRHRQGSFEDSARMLWAGYPQAVIPSFSLPVRSQCASRQSDRLPKLNMQTSVLRTIFIVSVLYVAWGCGEVQTNRYETVQDAR